MKQKHSVSDFTSERNALLMEHFRKQLAIQSKATVDRIFKGAADQPAPRFWVSEQRAAVVISRMLQSDDPESVIENMFEEKRAMYREIFRRVLILREQSPGAPICDFVFEVVNQPAPSSYMSWQRAKGIIYKERCRRRVERGLK